MSFDILQCENCNFSHSTMPRIYFTTEAGEIHVLMYPCGSEPFESRFGCPASPAAIEKKIGSVGNFHCIACGSTSEIADVNEKLCEHCSATNLVDLSELEGKLCPECGTGVIVRNASMISI